MEETKSLFQFLRRTIVREEEVVVSDATYRMLESIARRCDCTIQAALEMAVGEFDPAKVAANRGGTRMDTWGDVG